MPRIIGGCTEILPIDSFANYKKIRKQTAFPHWDWFVDHVFFQSFNHLMNGFVSRALNWYLPIALSLLLGICFFFAFWMVGAIAGVFIGFLLGRIPFYIYSFRKSGNRRNSPP